MNLYVVDASFAIKWILPENNTEKALTVLDRLQRFLVPDLFLIESDSIISKKVRRRELEVADADSLRGKIRKFPYILIPYKDISKFALELSSTMAISHYDACYLAVAIEYEGVLYTADVRMANGLTNTPFSDYVKCITDL